MHRPRFGRMALVTVTAAALLAACAPNSPAGREGGPAGAAGPVAGAPAGAPADRAGAPGPWQLAPVDVAWARIALPLPGGNSPRPLFPHRPEDQAVLARILGWLGQARPVEGMAGQAGRRSTLLIIRLADGSSVAVSPAFFITRQEGADGSVTIAGTTAPGQVWVSAPGRGQALRAPELRAFVEGGWQQELLPEPELAVAPVTVAPGEPFVVVGGGGAWVGARSATVYLVGPGAAACCDPESFPNPRSVLLGIVPVTDGRFTWAGTLRPQMGPTPSGEYLNLEPGPLTLQVAAAGAGGRTIQVTLVSGPG